MVRAHRAAHARVACVVRVAAASVVALTASVAGAVDLDAPDTPTPLGATDLQAVAERSRGRYGEDGATRIDVVTLVARHRGAGWIADVQVPYVEVRSDASKGGLPDTFGAGRRVERGLGDVVLRGTVEVIPLETDGTGLDLTAKVKAKTGDVSRGLGTGGTDVSLQVDATHAWRRALAFGSVGYRRTGDLAGFPRYRNPWYAEIGVVVPAGERWQVGTYGDARQAIGRLGPLREWTAFAGWRTGATLVQAYVTRGFATASPDWALGLSVRRRF